VEFNILLLSVACIICGLPWPDLQALCDSPHPAMQIWSFDPGNKSKSGNCRSTNLSFFLLKQCQRIQMSFEWFSFLEKDKKRTEKKRHPHKVWVHWTIWSMVLKDQGTSLRIYPKLSVLIGKSLVLLKILKTSQPTVILFWKKPIWNIFKILELEVISKSKKHHPQLHWHGLWTPESSST
jgi:hypothetical protein